MKNPNIISICGLIVALTITHVKAESLLNWIWSNNEESSPIANSNGIPLLSIPYEIMTEDEKFLKEAATLTTDLQISSPLEICQHKVVLKIKASCSQMTEEQLAKLSVNLLNCQSAIEGRQVFPCTDNMPIKECTQNMDADTWNAYHLMSNRARAVCYSARSQQFRALTEITVNKLMQSAHEQIKKLSFMKDSQDQLIEQSVSANKLMESNIQNLVDEKALIRAGHDQLVAMTEDIQNKLEKASQELMQQATERSHNHLEILADLENIQTQAQLFWKRIESSTNHIMDQNREAILQYEDTLKKQEDTLIKLEKINQTIVYILNLTDTMHIEIDKKLGWITEYIGSTGDNLEKIYRVTLHVIYLLAAMIFASFLQAPFLTRSAILGIVPLNLAAYLKHGLNTCFDFVSITVLILLITTMHYVMNLVQHVVRAKTEDCKKNVSVKKASYTNGHASSNGYTNLSEYIHPRQQHRFFWINITSISNLYNFMCHQIHHCAGKLKTIYSSMKSWIQNKSISTEELSCSYLPADKRKCIVSNYENTSDDDSDHNDDSSSTDAVSKRKTVLDESFSPLEAAAVRDSANLVHRATKVSVRTRLSSRRVIPRNICAYKSGSYCRLPVIEGKYYCRSHDVDY